MEEKEPSASMVPSASVVIVGVMLDTPVTVTHTDTDKDR